MTHVIIKVKYVKVKYVGNLTVNDLGNIFIA